MPDRDTTKRMFTHMINMMEQHDTMTISCGDPLMKLLKDVRELLNEQPEIVRCKDCYYYHKPEYGFTIGDCTYRTAWYPVKENEFCSLAKRKEVGEVNEQRT